MQQCFVERRTPRTLPIQLVRVGEWKAWLKKAPIAWRKWLEHSGFSGKVGGFSLLPDADGLAGAVAVIADKPDVWSIAALQRGLPAGQYVLEGAKLSAEEYENLTLGWALASYTFTRFRTTAKEKEPSDGAALVWPTAVRRERVLALAEAIFLVRDLINRPANDLTPLALAEEAECVAKKYRAKCTVTTGANLQKNYPLIHAVGRASANKPCLVDVRWGKQGAPKVTLVGKGICFDSGGLDIKSSGNMKLMKKDMGGAAHVLGLASIIMALKLPVQLRVLIAAAENAVGSDAFRPLDIIKSRKGLTVEIGNTDAEGRLVLSDALVDADAEAPDLLVDCATLTGAARVALGTEVPAFFTNDDTLAQQVETAALHTTDPLWRLPLWMGYDEMLGSDVADINSAPDSGYGGAITAALYLKRFVEKSPRWLHIDMMAWNLRSRPGRPTGGEAMGLRALLALLETRYLAKPSRKIQKRR